MAKLDPKIRRRARERAVQYLFSVQFHGEDSDEGRAEFWESFPSKPSVREYAERLIDGVLRERTVLDDCINGALKNWAPDRVGRIERSALRVALYETLHERDVPRKVAMNEAIEVVKVFGGEEATRFVNGVLDRVVLPNEPRSAANS